MNKKKRFYLIILLLFLSVAVCCLTQLLPKRRLDDKEIQKLRLEYPIMYKGEVNPLMSVDTSKSGIRKIVEGADTFVYCEIIGEPVYRKIFIGTGIAELDKEVFENTEYNAVQYHFPIRIISDTEGIFEKGQEITYCYGVTNQDYDPNRAIGEKIVIPIYISGGESKGEFYTSIKGYYYITTEGYAISAFSENNIRYNGLKVDVLMESLAKTESEREAYLELKKQEYEWFRGEDGFVKIEDFKSKVKNELVPKNQELVKSLKENSLAEK